MQRFVLPGENSLVSIIVPLSLTDDYCYVGNLERFTLTDAKPINHIIRYYEEPGNQRLLQERIATEIERRKDNFQQLAYSTKLTKKEIFLYIPLILAGLAPESLPFVGDELKKIIEKLGDVGGTIGGTTATVTNPLSTMKWFSAGDRLFSSIPFLAGAYFLARTRIKKYNAAKSAEIENEFRKNVCAKLDRIADEVRYQTIEAFQCPLNEFFADRIEVLLGDNFTEPTTSPDKNSYLAFKSIITNPQIFSRASYPMQRYFRKKVEMYESR